MVAAPFCSAMLLCRRCRVLSSLSICLCLHDRCCLTHTNGTCYAVAVFVFGLHDNALDVPLLLYFGCLQLPPTVLCPEAKDGGLGMSMFSRLMHAGIKPILLNK